MDNLLKKAIKRTSRKKVITQLKVYALVNPRVTRRTKEIITRIQHFGAGAGPGKRNWDPAQFRSTATPGKPVRPPGLPPGMSIKDMMGGSRAKAGESGYKEKPSGGGANRKIRESMLAQHMLKKQADITKREARRDVLNDMVRKMSVKANRREKPVRLRSIKDMMGGSRAKSGESGYKEKSAGSGTNRKIRDTMLAQHMLKKKADITKREARRNVLNDMVRKMSVKVNRAQSDFKRYARKAEAFMEDPKNQDKFGPMWMDPNFLTRAQAVYLRGVSRPGTPPGERLPPPPTAAELKQIIAKNVSRQQFVLGGEAVLSEVPPGPSLRSRSAPIPRSAKSLSPMAPAWTPPPTPARSPPNLPANEQELRNMLKNWGASSKIQRPVARRP